VVPDIVTMALSLPASAFQQAVVLPRALCLSGNDYRHAVTQQCTPPGLTLELGL